MRVCLWFVCFLIVPATVQAAPETIRTTRVQLQVQAGVVTAVANRLTNESFSFSTAPPLTGIRHLREGEMWNTSAQVKRKTTVQGVTTTLHWQREDSSYSLTTLWRILPEGEVLVTQRAEGTHSGLVGLQWGIVVPDEWDLLVPAHGGLRFSKDSDYHPRQFQYPMEWEAQFVLIQGKKGGLLIHAEDNAQKFKRLFLQRRKGQFWVGFETWCTAPFEKVQQAGSVSWRIRPYTGNWLHGVAMYRQWAEEAFGLITLRQTQPAWVQEIQTIVIDNLDDMEKIEALAKRLNPRQTLIYVPDWRQDGYDRNYPDYTPRNGFAERTEQVRRLGFRIMLHVNYFGCTPENPAYENLKQYHFRDPFNRQPLYWEWSTDPPIKFAYINPAAKAWRQLFVSRMVELCRQLKPDALHLDQTLCIFNDANGLIDGMNAMQGNIALHRELREALPEIAFSGEGLNEISFRYESFAQRHVWGLDHTRQTWDSTLVRMTHPVCSAILTPHTRLYGYLGMCSPRMWHYYTAWRTAYDRLGVLPTFGWLDKELVTQPDVVIQTLWEEACWFQKNCPLPDFNPNLWKEKILFVYRTRNGKVARYRQDAVGVCLEVQRGKGWQTVSRRIEGTHRARIKGSIPHWRAYDKGALLGLNLDTVYPWSPEPLPHDATRLSDLSDGVMVAAAAVQEGEWAWFTLKPLGQTVPLWRRVDSVTHSVVDPSGTVVKKGSGYIVDTDIETGAVAVPVGEGLFIHPPYRNYRGGSTWLQFHLNLPTNRKAEFRSRVGFYSPYAAERSDGITFRVTVMAGRERISKSQQVKGIEAQELVVDLTPFCGQRVTIRLETNPGPNGSPDFDHGYWIRPRVLFLPKEEQEAEIYSHHMPVKAWLNGQDIAWCRSSANRYGVKLPPSLGTLVILFRRLQPVSLPLCLRQYPFQTGLLGIDGMMYEPSGYLKSVVSFGTCKGVTKASLFAHPPPNGKNFITFVLVLPSRKTVLRGFVGINDGAEGKSNGVRFSIEVNGKEVWSQTVRAGEGWMPFIISLSEWAGQTVLLQLVTDSLGDYSWDWAHWGEVQIE